MNSKYNLYEYIGERYELYHESLTHNIKYSEKYKYLLVQDEVMLRSIYFPEVIDTVLENMNKIWDSRELIGQRKVDQTLSILVEFLLLIHAFFKGFFEKVTEILKKIRSREYDIVGRISSKKLQEYLMLDLEMEEQK